MPGRQKAIGILSIVAGIALIAFVLLSRAGVGLVVGVILGVLLVANGALRFWLAGRHRAGKKP
jgi:hypothetical protein